MNIVLITAGRRWEILKQSITSMVNNSADWTKHELIVSIDCWAPSAEEFDWITRYCARFILNRKLGASASRNIGASSIPKYRRQEYICFFDDDVYCCPRWDRRIVDALDHSKGSVSGHAHPYNHTILADMSHYSYQITTVLSTVNIACSWEIWDSVGFFAEPGGPGGSEDVDWCTRPSNPYKLAITQPMCVIHTGLTSSSGKPIVGADLVMERNKELERLHKIEGKVRYG